MSTKALRDLNIIPASGLDKTIDSKGTLTKLYTENGSEFQKKTPPLCSVPAIKVDMGTTVAEIGNAEVEYIESENLGDVPDLDACFNVCFYSSKCSSHPTACSTLTYQCTFISFPFFPGADTA